MQPSIPNGNSTSPMPIAVIGIGCRFSGDGSDAESFWKMLVDGRSARTEVPKSRYNINGFYHPDPDRSGTTATRTAHFIKEDFRAFDAPFFSITPKEAKAMDPPQRLLLEVAYEGLENAGLRVEDVMGSNTSCFIGSFTGDFKDLMLRDNEGFPMKYATGLSPFLASNRLSWFFDLCGPSVTVETACSSSLVAFHLGCQSLQSGEATMSIVGGHSLMFGPDMTVSLTGAHILSPDGKCHAFDHRAGGFSRGEGIGITILKPLDLALRDGDTIRAIIPATASNQNGRTAGMGLPSSEAQMELIKTVYKLAGANMSDTGYVEAHGTGTPVGDRLEMSAIAKTIGAERQSKLYVGSVKTNIGHLEGGAGLAGLIKTVLLVERGLIPPNLWFEKLNPSISLDPNKVEVPVELTAWPTQGLRRASVNSFGFGGANAHVIVEDAYHYLKARGLSGHHFTTVLPSLDTIDKESFLGSTGKYSQHNGTNGHGPYTNGFHSAKPKIFVLSSNDQGGVVRLAKQFLAYAEKKPVSQEEKFLEDLSFTLAEKRSVLPWKSFAIASTLEELCTKLGNIPSAMRSSQSPKLAFVFTGQGAQWFAMGRELSSYVTYQDTIRTCDLKLRALGCSWSLKEELNRPESESRLSLAELSQPACTAIQIALVDLLESWDIVPAAVIGHSSGEIAAAYCSGAISSDSAISIAYFRGKSATLIAKNPNLRGAMMAVSASAESIQPYLTGLESGKVVVCCVNSPVNCTVSGDATAIDELKSQLSESRISFTKLKVEIAYHSPHMENVREEYLKFLTGMDPALQTKPTTIPMFSSVTGNIIRPEELGPSYWVKNLLSQVKFSGAVTSLLKFSDGHKTKHERNTLADAFIEVGPHSALRGPLTEIFSNGDKTFKDIPYISVLRRGHSAISTTLKAVGELYSAGYGVDLRTVNELSEEAKMLVDMPVYPWNHSTLYWEESYLTRDYRLREQPRYDLLGYPAAGTTHPQWRNFLRVRENPWIKHHKVQSTILYPAAGMVIMAIEGARQNADPNEEILSYELRDIYINTAMRVPDDGHGLEVTLDFHPRRTGTKSDTATWIEFIVSSYVPDSSKWQKHCTGLIQVIYKSSITPAMDAEFVLENQKYKEAHLAAKDRCSRSVDTLYETLESIGLEYGKTFRNLAEVYSGDGCGCGVVRIPDTKATMPLNFEHPCVIHPATLDAVFHLLFPVISSPDSPIMEAFVPVSIDRLYISADISSNSGVELQGHSEGRKTGYNTWSASIVMAENDWEKPRIVVENIGIASVGEKVSHESDVRDLCAGMIWQEDIDLMNNDQIAELIVKRSTPDPDDDKMFDTLDYICLSYICGILEWLKSRNEPVPLESVFKLYHKWMENKIDSRKLPPSDPVELESELRDARHALRDSRAGSLCLQLIDRMGHNLEKIFTKEIQPLQVMLEGDLLYTFYREGLGNSINENIAEYIGLAAYKKPNISILEIGAGTGGTSYHVLKKLRCEDGSHQASRYVYTDISPGFLAKAAEKFADAQIMEFTTLNIEEDPIQQGFKPESFDIILAANVLHATKHIAQTLAHVRSLLKPGGKLVLSEITDVNMIFTGFVMGSLPGWWLGEADGRRGGPLLTVEQWDQALKDAAFTGVDICVHGDSNATNKPVSLLVAEKKRATLTMAHLDDLVIISDHRENTQIFATSLQSAFKTRGHEASIIQWDSHSPCDVKNKYCISLLELENSFLLDISDENFAKLQALILGAAQTLWVTVGGTGDCPDPHSGLMTGLSRSIRNENVNVALTTIDLEPQDTLNATVAADSIYKVAMHLLSSDNFDHEYSVAHGAIKIPRITKNPVLNSHLSRFETKGAPELVSFTNSERALKLSIKTPGLLDTLRFVEDETQNEPLDPDWVEVRVRATGVNFKDILSAMGNLKDDEFGYECSGTVTRVGSNVKQFAVGDRIFSDTANTFATFVRFPAVTAEKIPDDMTFEEAASIPNIYHTAYYSLVTAGHLEAGESVLIHAAAGGVGQAAIVIAQWVGAEIFATVGSSEKRELLKSEYGIPEDHIFNSRDLSFAKGIERATNGKGVDVVLNSLSGEALRLSWHCLAKFGRFVEIGKADIFANSGLDMEPFLANRSFIGANLLEFTNNPTPRSIRLAKKVNEMLFNKVIKPVTPLTVFTFSQFEQAFRHMQTGKHMGKIVVKVDDSDLVLALPPSAPVPIRKDATYVFAGGVGGVGRCIGRWFAEKGAKNLVFLSRAAASAPDNIAFVAELRKTYGMNAMAFNCDVGDKASLEATLKECAKTLPPIKGVVTGAMVLKDSLFENMSAADFRAALGPKVHGSWNLHSLLPTDLDFFVMLSSLVGIIGHRSQSNYAAGNAFQDALARHRVSKGLRGCTIDMGWMLNVGFVAENDQYLEGIKGLGVQIVHERELHAIIATAMEGVLHDKSPLSPQVISGLPWNGVNEDWYWIHDGKFAMLRNQKKGKLEESVTKVSLASELAQAGDMTAAVEVVRLALMDKLAKLMMVPTEDIDASKPLNAYGVDSLVAVEVRNWIAHEIKAEVSVFDIMSNVPMSSLAVTLASRSKLLKEHVNGDAEKEA